MTRDMTDDERTTMTRDMTDDERRDITECTELVRDVRDVAGTDAGAQAVGAALDAMTSFLERGEVFEADDPPEDTTEGQCDPRGDRRG